MAKYGLGTWHISANSVSSNTHYAEGSFIVYIPPLNAYTASDGLYRDWGAPLCASLANGNVYWLYDGTDGWRDERCKDIIVLDCEDSDITNYVLGDIGELVAPLKVKNGDNWVLPSGKIKVDGAWRQLGYGWTKVNGIWRRTI